MFCNLSLMLGSLSIKYKRKSIIKLPMVYAYSSDSFPLGLRVPARDRRGWNFSLWHVRALKHKQKRKKLCEVWVR